MYTLYVIPGSHACRGAMLMLRHKRLPYRRVDIVTLLHPLAVRLYGFPASAERRSVGPRQGFGLRIGDFLGTVPALAADGGRVSSNHDIARFLDARHPERPLLPADPEQRRAVEEAERWANGPLQMESRRILLGAGASDPSAYGRIGANGRMGYLLYRSARLRTLLIPIVARVFSVDAAADRRLVARLPELLDQVDAWIAEGVIGGDEPNAADLMVAPCLALILYRPELRPLFEGRPALELVDRLLPDPAQAAPQS